MSKFDSKSCHASVSHPDSKPCDTCSFASFCLLDDQKILHSKQVNLVVKQHYHLKRNQTLYLSKQTFRHLYAVQRGALKAYQVDFEGKELIQGFYFAGEVMGYEAIHNHEYSNSAVALLDTVVCEIPYDDFVDVLEGRPHLLKKVLSLVSHQLNMGSYLSSRTAEQRLIAFLLDMSARLFPRGHPPVDHVFVLPMSRQDIGEYLRLTAETVSRLFTRLQKSKLIKIKHKKIQLLDMISLQAKIL